MFRKFRHDPLFRLINNEADLVKLAEERNFNYFNNYYKERDHKRVSFRNAISHLNINLNGKVFLDIGPGTGDSLDVAKEMGAARCMAVDMEPFFIKLLLLRGYQAYLKNYTTSRLTRGFFPAEVGGVDFIWSKGALNCVDVNNGAKNIVRKSKDHIKGFDFNKWIIEMKSMLNPGGAILFMPAVGLRKEKLIDKKYPLTTYYYVDDVESWDKSFFSKILIKNEFSLIKDIPKYNHPKAFPTAFLYRNET